MNTAPMPWPPTSKGVGEFVLKLYRASNIEDHGEAHAKQWASFFGTGRSNHSSNQVLQIAFGEALLKIEDASQERGWNSGP